MSNNGKRVDWNGIGPGGVRFYGKVSASLSHDLKNSLAIINENAGLLQDLLALAAQGRPLDPERLTKSMERITRQVGVANDTIIDLNRLSHLIDTPLRKIDLAEDTALALRLHKRLASQKSTTFTLEETADPCELTTDPYLLSQALHHVLALLLDAPADMISVRVERGGSGCGIQFSGDFGTLSPPGGDELEAVLGGLGASIGTGPGTLALRLADLQE